MPEFSWETEEEGRIRWLTCEEEREMIDTLTRLGRPDVAAFVKVAIDTGCRRGELLNTPLMDLDGDWLRLWGDRTKTKVSRSVPLTPEAKALLKAHLPWQLTEPQLRYWWDVAKEKIGLGQDDLFVLHACRHTCATRLVEAGVNLRVVQEFMGHASIKTTERYAHVSPDTLAQAAAKLTARKPQLRKVG
jgi:integrase